METNLNFSPKFVACVRNQEYQASLELYKIYHVLPDEDARIDGDFRVVDESGEDYLYPSDYFVPIEIPKDLEQAILQSD